jgi:hypothetical protein
VSRSSRVFGLGLPSVWFGCAVSRDNPSPNQVQ